MAGDDYATRDILQVEGVATLVAGLCGEVLQSCPYIGHPAYKEMGGRPATLCPPPCSWVSAAY